MLSRPGDDGRRRWRERVGGRRREEQDQAQKRGGVALALRHDVYLGFGFVGGVWVFRVCPEAIFLEHKNTKTHISRPK